MWDIHTMKPLKVVSDAHETGITGLEYAPLV